MWAQSLGEYGAASTLAEAFTNLWVSGRDWVMRTNPVWFVVAVVVLLLVFRRKR
jgi:hypothetical protein